MEEKRNSLKSPEERPILHGEGRRTGLEDVKHKEIFVGDILYSVLGGRLWIVKYHNRQYWIYEEHYTPSGKHVVRFYVANEEIIYRRGLRVIGNLRANPELTPWWVRKWGL